MEEKYKKLKELIQSMRCDECDGVGSISTPSDFSPCGNCEGTGLIIDGSYDDVFGYLDEE